MSNSFCNQVLAQIELWKNSAQYENKVYILPKKLDEKVARSHLNQLGVNLTVLTDAQAKYINVPVEGPYKRIIIVIDLSSFPRSGLGMQSAETQLLRLNHSSKARRASTAVFPRRPWERYILDFRQ